MNGEFDLDAYLKRIGYAGDRAASRATLAGLTLAHAQAIPFESLDPLLGRPVRLDIASLQEKLVGASRGGYCFEHNALLQRALAALGFSVTGLAARVVMNLPPDTVTARTHMVLKVELADGPAIADVGFGGMTPTGPLLLRTGLVQGTPHESFRLADSDGEYRLDALIGDTWTPIYRFDLQPQTTADYEVTNFYTSTHPASAFVTRLIAARPVPGGRWALSNTSLARHRLGGETERRTLSSAAELRDALTDIFGIVPPADAGLEPALARIAGGEA
ncbi:arylamine N-acetyltransferase [Microbaculum marinum]|uniref:Arylamine N-acetyltransferase n=1 Tax=Microbaculum marinum TaxID=1764581 RepID=A0AAW9S5L3_9HYPH